MIKSRQVSSPSRNNLEDSERAFKTLQYSNRTKSFETLMFKSTFNLVAFDRVELGNKTEAKLREKNHKHSME